MTMFRTTLHLPAGVAEDQVDKIGRAVLVEQARLRKQTITGPVERIYDEFVVGVPVEIEGQVTIQHVPILSTAAAGRTDPDARLVTWQAETTPITADPAVVIHGVARGNLSSGEVPAEVTAAGGMITFFHGLAHDDVTITALDAQGNSVYYEFAIEISSNEQQILVGPGATQVQATVNVEDNR